jgi:hypothetical protein
VYGFDIRRLLSIQPILHAVSDTLAATTHPAASPLTSRTAGGLGRGLAGILDPVPAVTRRSRPGLQRLLGRRDSVTPPRVRQFVTDTALGVIAEGFEADAVAIAHVDDVGQPVVATRLPPSWEGSSSLTFALYGHLWALLEGRPETDWGDDRCRTRQRGVAAADECRIGGFATWLGGQATTRGPFAAAVMRREPFTAVECDTLTRLIRSVGVALGPDRSALPHDAVVKATARCDGTRWRTETVVEVRGKRRRAFAEAGTRELAIARAAAKLSRRPVEVAFAGRTDMDGTAVTIVVVVDENQSPYLGLALTDPAGGTGAVEAVFSAVGAMDS